ncbi:hypothetical protein CTEN210_06069 [Chaetoceros tenuissimus]|uniref:Uncharacterized protein n=1 Tax=Chaetoceros tenuissimus TaxID=426638 RepID=A0AAD3H4D2_9STRA|nr:hypothetical protein CTEN210_06069 [Chaetoceros tenuissimus]
MFWRNLAILSLAVGSASAFAPAPPRSSSTALHLKTSQGQQLVAAAAAIEHKDTNGVKKDVTPTGAAREAVTRIFNLPSEILKIQKETLDIDLPFLANGEQEDFVYYPLVGFQFVKVEERVVALPSSTVGAINIKNRAQAQKQEVFGWYSPTCQLGNPYSDDDEAYCGASLATTRDQNIIDEVPVSEM